MAKSSDFKRIIGGIIAVYDSRVIRWYCAVRFRILRQRFLDEIGQYLPASGNVIDVGCGFGLFSLYYATRNSALRLSGIDIDERRIEAARLAAERLDLGNATYRVGDAVGLAPGERLDGAYMLDIVHHIPVDAVPPLFRTLYAALNPGARLIVKDIETTPAYKRVFTFLLDKLMDWRTPVSYWDRKTLLRALNEAGFDVAAHAMVDYLPYPHVLYVCRKPERPAGETNA